MGRYIFLGLTLYGIWLLLSGYLDNILLLSFGALSAALCVFLAARANVLDEEGVPAGLVPQVFGYLWWLTGEIGKANIAVAREALALQPKLSPKVFRVKMTQKTNAGRAIFANSITLTPGTVSICLEDDYIVVHALTEAMGDEGAHADVGERVARLERAPR